MSAVKQKLQKLPDSDGALIVICAVSVFLPFYLCNIVILLTLVNALRRHMAQMIFRPAHYRWLYAFCLLAVAVGAVYRHWVGIAAFVLLIILFLFGFYSQYRMNENIRHGVILVVAYGSIVSFAAALIEKFPDAAFRSTSLFANANYYAYLCEIFIVALVFAIYRYGSSPLYYAAIAANIGGIMASGCRSAWPAAFFGVIVVMLCFKKYLHLAISLLAGVLAAVLVTVLPTLLFPRIGTMKSDTNLRVLIWKTALRYVRSHPLFGQGMLSYLTVSTGRAHDAHAHNLPLDLLVNFGIAGTVLITVFVAFYIIRLVRGLRVNPSGAIALGVMTVSFVHGFTDVPFIGLQTGPTLILLISLAGGCNSLSEEKGYSSIRPTKTT